MGRQGVSRPCARAGCRAWAARDGLYCRSHRDHAVVDDVNVSAREQRSLAFAAAIKRGDLASLDTALRHAIAGCAAELSLEQEIGVLRLILLRVIAMDALDGDPESVARTATRLVETIVRAVRMQHALTGAQAGSLADALATILTELGLGDEP
jgi:hypothetical protein